MFEKVLIANRGEIAARIARTCKHMGVATVAVHSDIDVKAAHVLVCDEAASLGGKSAPESYLKGDAIIKAAKKHGAEAIHPGYGFLSENAAFAKEVRGAGLVFIGPSEAALSLFGDKGNARELAIKRGLRVLPATAATDDLKDLLKKARNIEEPWMVKAVAGGGGIGMQRVDDEDDLEGAIEKCSTRAARSFGDGRVYVEHCVDRPRHVEVQILADSHEQIVALGERECSVQRRHQKLVEESPAPALRNLRNGEQIREAMFEAAIDLLQAGKYENAGTVEYILDDRGRFYFLEVNSRLQVEHAVTELCTGIDLVEWQMRIAAGDKLDDEVLHPNPSGHAVEARLCAEQPEKDFLPSPGPVEELRIPPLSPARLRVELGVNKGDEVTPYYDSMFAKIITYGHTRHRALLTLDRVLAGTVVGPLSTNREFLRSVLADRAFQAGQYDVTLAQRLTQPSTDDE